MCAPSRCYPSHSFCRSIHAECEDQLTHLEAYSPGCKGDGGPPFIFFLTTHRGVDDSTSIVQHGVTVLGFREPGDENGGARKFNHKACPTLNSRQRPRLRPGPGLRRGKHARTVCGKTQNVVIPRHALCRGISLSLGFERREIPRFARNDTLTHFVRKLCRRRGGMFEISDFGGKSGAAHSPKPATVPHARSPQAAGRPRATARQARLPGEKHKCVSARECDRSDSARPVWHFRFRSLGCIFIVRSPGRIGGAVRGRTGEPRRSLGHGGGCAKSIREGRKES